MCTLNMVVLLCHLAWLFPSMPTGKKRERKKVLCTYYGKHGVQAKQKHFMAGISAFIIIIIIDNVLIFA